MTVWIVEDEKLNADHLTRLLRLAEPQIEIAGYYVSVAEVMQALAEQPMPDILFLDIHLADGNCFQLFEKRDITIPVIFTTAYHEYAIRAFKVNSIDYLLKPIALPDVLAALHKYRSQQRIASGTALKQLAQTIPPISGGLKNRFMVKSGSRIETIPTEDIHHFQTRDSITFLVTPQGKRFAVDYTLDEIENLVSPQTFFRINRKTILHIRSIVNVQAYTNSRLQVIAEFLEPDHAIVSRERVNDFKQWLDS
jgi:DNA-binding LytR/AlgR family response regulator